MKSEDVVEHLLEIKQRLARIEENQKNLDDKQDRHMSQADINTKRLAELEATKHKGQGALWAMSFLGLVLGIAANFVKVWRH